MSSLVPYVCEADAMTRKPERLKPHRGTIFSIGYEGRDLDSFLDILEKNHVKVLVDVRLTPISRKKGFSKTALSERLAERGIDYRHARALGNPKDNRAAFRGAATQAARRRYLAHLSNGSRPAFDELIELARSQRVALLCVESDERQCHRGCITDQAQNEHPALSVQRL